MHSIHRVATGVSLRCESAECKRTLGKRCANVKAGAFGVFAEFMGNANWEVFFITFPPSLATLLGQVAGLGL